MWTGFQARTGTGPLKVPVRGRPGRGTSPAALGVVAVVRVAPRRTSMEPGNTYRMFGNYIYCTQTHSYDGVKRSKVKTETIMVVFQQGQKVKVTEGQQC